MTPTPNLLLCAWCQRVRTGNGRWEENDLAERERTEATHGICPECLAEETRALLCAAPPVTL